MASLADEMRAEALRRKGEVVNRKLSGWSFSLSYGQVDPVKVAADLEELGIVAQQLLQKLRVVHDGKDKTKAVIERLRSGVTGDESVSSDEWMLSAKLFPPGRSSTKADWVFLGKMCAALHVPRAVLAETSPPADANATHYWKWRDS